MMNEPNSIRDDNARCMTCGFIGKVSLKPDVKRYSFHCSGCGYVVPCYDHNARGEKIRAYASPYTLDDLPINIVPAKGDYAPREFAWGCLTCLGTVTAIVWQARQPFGGLLIHDHGQCERCGHVVLVSPADEPTPRFRAFAEDGSRRPADG